MEMVTVRNDNHQCPFTSIQWQELEHQALVYKYMISGMPIPPDLLFSIKTSLDSSTKLIPHHHSPHQSIGWGYFHMGFGRKIDPEPGRCRRTDGKKWRCSKEAYPDSKYCERHMHRGRNRSRKPVEANLLTNSTPNTPLSSSLSPSICTKSSKYPSQGPHPPFVHSSGSPGGNVVSSQDRFLLVSSPYSRSGKDRSYGTKEDVDEHPFLLERCGRSTIFASAGDSCLLEPLTVNSSSSPAQSKQQSFYDYQNDYSYLQLQNISTRQKQDQGRCYDQLALKIEGKDEAHKVMHHFFDESPDDHNKDNDSSTTQLSISIPSCGHDFLLTRNDK